MYPLNVNARSIDKNLKKSITLFKELKDNYLRFVDTFNNGEIVITKATAKIDEADTQLNKIYNFKAEKGYFPELASKQSAQSYIQDLNEFKAENEREVSSVVSARYTHFKNNQAIIRKLTHIIAISCISNKDASQFLGMIQILSPTFSSENRCVKNELMKPIYTGALMIAFLRRLLIDEQPLGNELSQFSQILLNDGIVSEMPKSEVSEFIYRVAEPMLTGVILSALGAYTEEATERGFNKFGKELTDEQRKSFAELKAKYATAYLEWGIGNPENKPYLNTEEYHLETAQHQVTSEFIKIASGVGSNESKLLSNIFKIPSIYASITLSTKPNYKDQVIYKANQVVEKASSRNVVCPILSTSFFKLVGLYPIGTGVYFMSQETMHVERGIVILLNPPEPDSYIVKQVTRKLLFMNCGGFKAIYSDTMFCNPDTRKASGHPPNFIKNQFQNKYTWEANDRWDIQVDAHKFWKGDKTVRSNKPFRSGDSLFFNDLGNVH